MGRWWGNPKTGKVPRRIDLGSERGLKSDTPKSYPLPGGCFPSLPRKCAKCRQSRGCIGGTLGTRSAAVLASEFSPPSGPLSGTRMSSWNGPANCSGSGSLGAAKYHWISLHRGRQIQTQNLDAASASRRRQYAARKLTRSPTAHASTMKFAFQSGLANAPVQKNHRNPPNMEAYIHFSRKTSRLRRKVPMPLVLGRSERHGVSGWSVVAGGGASRKITQGFAKASGR